MRYAERSIPAWERNRLAVDVQLDRQPGPADLVQQRVDAVEAGLRHELGLFPFAAHRGEQAAHLGECGTACALDVRERPALLAQLVGKLMPDGAHLEHHHAHRVGDDVVEFARDPCTLLRDRDSCGRLALAFGLRRAGLGRLRLLRTVAEDKPRGPADAEVDRDDDQLGRRSGRGCCRRP